MQSIQMTNLCEKKDKNPGPDWFYCKYFEYSGSDISFCVAKAIFRTKQVIYTKLCS